MNRLLKCICLLFVSCFISCLPVYAQDAPYMDICVKYGTRYNIPPHILNAVCYVESRYIPDADKGSGKGLCQIVTKWHKSNIELLEIDNIYNPEQNIKLCAKILYDLTQQGYSISDALIIYNMGPTNAKPYLGKSTAYSREVLTKAEELK